MKRLLTSILAGVIVFGLVAAFAATLNVTGGGIGAETVTVDSCDDGVAFNYDSAFDATAGEYELTALTVSGLDGTCTSLDINFAGESFNRDISTTSGDETFTLTTPVPAEGFVGPVNIVVSS